MNKINGFVHKMLSFFFRMRLKNKEFTIISSNCIAGVIYKDLGMEFFSPTINLFFYPADFIKFCKNLKYYLGLDLEECNGSSAGYPIGKLEDIYIHFMHYDSFEEAKEAWDRRKKRVNYNNLFIIMVDKDGCTSNDIKEFHTIKDNKILLTSKLLNEEDIYTITGFENMDYLGNIIEYDPKNKFRRYYEQFDFISFFNSKN